MKKKLIIASIILLIITIIGLAAFFFLQSKKSNEEEDLDNSTENTVQVVPSEIDSVNKIPKKWKEMPPKFEPLGSFLINLKSDNPKFERFAQIDLSIEYFSKSNLDDFKKFQPIIHHDILIYLSQQTAETLLTSEGKILILKEVMTILKKHLNNKDEYFLSNIIFKTLIIQ